MLRTLRRLNTYRWRVHVPVTVVGIFGVVYVALRPESVSVTELMMLFCGWVLINGLGTSVGMHRIFAHRTHALTGWMNGFVAVLATLACEGSTIWWCAMHRGQHHPHSDTDRDVHSPRHGVWHAAVGWTASSRVQEVNLRHAADLLRDPVHMWLHVNYLGFINFVWVYTLLLSPQLFLWFLVFPTAFGIWRESLENVVSHTPALGYRNYQTNDRSTNVWWMALFTWGNGWHNNHHANPAAYDFGSGTSGRWWELDPSRIFLPLLKRYERTTLESSG
jgi:fatty-acid desaturase